MSLLYFFQPCLLSIISLLFFYSSVVFPPGRVGEHGALDALLRRLLRHLAHHPDRPRHAGPGKLLSVNTCHLLQ